MITPGLLLFQKRGSTKHKLVKTSPGEAAKGCTETGVTKGYWGKKLPLGQILFYSQWISSKMMERSLELKAATILTSCPFVTRGLKYSHSFLTSAENNGCFTVNTNHRLDSQILELCVPNHSMKLVEI